ncbi:MAG: PDZ domain-containing protein, partial [Paludibacteraceae bacterium]|nr:PDZ domain-containing protein [Paludibacteraceae bacterium]
MNRKTIIFLPIIIAVSVAVGIVFANLMMKNTEKEQVPISIAASDNKINQIIRLINNNYVDTVSIGLIEDNVIPKMLRELDPHSVYIPKKDLERVNEELGSSFSGVGIQFSIQHDTVMAVSIISGGPSEKAGLIAGDRIVAVDDSVFVGKQITNEKVLNTLRGEKGTKVKVTVKRSGTSELLHYNIVRGDIPLYSVDVAYKIKDDIGYINVSKFSENTYKEFVIALAKLKNQGCSKYIVDLRENSGGYLEQVVYMVNEFLPAGDLIVYTEGEHSPRNDVYATGSGAFQNNK